MLESLCDALFVEAVDFGIAGVLWLVSLVFPLRRLSSRPEFSWDAIAVVAVLGFAYVADFMLAMPVHSLMMTGWLSDWHAHLTTWHWATVILGYIVLADLGAYWAHRALHSPMLWAQHAWHHSPKYLYWASGLRGSFLDTLVLFAPYSLAYVMFPRREAGFVGMAMLLLHAANQHYIHSNIAIPFARQIELLFVTSRYHFVHHHADKRAGNSNFGFIFTVWDRLFGTYTDPATVARDAPLGLDYPTSNWRLLLGLPERARKEACVQAQVERRPHACSSRRSPSSSV